MDVAAASATANVCEQCGASLTGGTTCQGVFERMLALEFQHPATFGAVHHLTVLCYNVQHPAGYTDAFWDYTAALLMEVVERDMPAAALRRRMRHELAGETRRIQIKGTPTRSRRYAWTMRAVDVPTDDAARYAEGVRAWARAIVAALRAG